MMINRELLETHLEEFDQGVTTFKICSICSWVAEFHLVHVGVEGFNLTFVLFHICRIYLLRNLNLLIQHFHLIVQFFKALTAYSIVE